MIPSNIIHQGNGREIYLVNNYIIKKFGDSHGKARIRKERNIQKVAASLGIAPKVYEWEDVREIIGGGANGDHCIVMDYIEGQHLKLPTEKHNAVLKEMISKLEMSGISHRDIKSENIILSTEGRIYIIDFGESTMFIR